MTRVRDSDADARWDNPSKSYRAVRKLGLLAAVLGNLVCTAFLTYISTQNYPGGEVGLLLQRLAAGNAGQPTPTDSSAVADPQAKFGSPLQRYTQERQYIPSLPRRSVPSAPWRSARPAPSRPP